MKITGLSFSHPNANTKRNDAGCDLPSLPSLSVQLYIIHVVTGGHSGRVFFSCVFALLLDKSTSTCKRLIEILRNVRPNLSP